MGIPVAEQETSIQYMRDGDACTVYTTDSTVMTRLDKLAADPASPWSLKKEHYIHGEVIGKTYQAPKRLISFRSSVVVRELTPEQKEAAAMRMRNWQEAHRKGEGVWKSMEKQKTDF